MPCLIQKVLEFFAAGGMAQLAQRLGLDLANALPRHVENAPDFLERPAASTPKPSFSPTTSTRLPAGNFRPAPKPSASPASGAPCMFAVDDRVVHDTFGRGTVLEVNGSGLDSKLLVKFDNGQTKHLLLKFARLRKIQ